MKKIIAVFALICVFAAAGCNNGEAPKTTTAASSSETTTTTAAVSADENGNNSQVVFDNTREDTTAEALAYLEKECPLFKKYLDMRRSVPLTFESTTITVDGEYKTGLYIKDAENFAQYSKDPAGNETRVIYMKDTAYQITSADKTILKYDCNEEVVKSAYEDVQLAKIYLDDVQSSSYSYGSGEYDGVAYNKVTVSSSDGTSNDMYFDINTDKLSLSVANGSVSTVDTFENSFTKDEIFNIPEDYEVKSFNEYLEELQKQAIQEQESQIAEQQAAIEESKAAESSAETTE